MSGRFVAMMTVGLLLMFGFWAKQWSRDVAETERLAPTRDCVLANVTCPGHSPICFTHKEVPKGVCTSRCVSTDQCDEHWCCGPDPSAPKEAEHRCLPPELCRGR